VKRLWIASALALGVHGVLLNMNFSGPLQKPLPDTLLNPVALTLLSETPEQQKILPADQMPDSRPVQREPDRAPAPLSAPQQRSRLKAAPKVRQRFDTPSLTTPGLAAAPQLTQSPIDSNESDPENGDMPEPVPPGGGAGARIGKSSQGSIAEDARQTTSQSPVREAFPLYDRNPPPPYPQQARKRGFHGTVILKVLVGKDGRVGDLQVQESSGHDILDQIALEAVRSWAFTPGHRGEEPVEMWVRVPIQFELK
jgi:protein TonB